MRIHSMLEPTFSHQLRFLLLNVLLCFHNSNCNWNCPVSGRSRPYCEQIDSASFILFLFTDQGWRLHEISNIELLRKCCLTYISSPKPISLLPKLRSFWTCNVFGMIEAVQRTTWTLYINTFLCPRFVLWTTWDLYKWYVSSSRNHSVLSIWRSILPG